MTAVREPRLRREQLSPWIWQFVRDGPSSPTTFVLAPFGSGSAYSVADWATHLLAPGETALAIQYPGRGPRGGEPPAASLADLAKAAANDVMRFTEGAVVLGGHSFGAVVGHEMAVHLEANGRKVELLVLSAARPPEQTGMDLRHVMAMDRSQWRAELSRNDLLEGDATVMDDLLDLLIPVLRADYLLLGRHARAGGPVRCPVLALGGEDDPHVSAAHLAGWRPHTAGPFSRVLLPGGHFYFRHQLPQFAGHVRDALQHARGDQ
jgi:surfactin synthase thioesterase subunit